LTAQPTPQRTPEQLVTSAFHFSFSQLFFQPWKAVLFHFFQF